jgi:hypothetical protein
MSKLKDVWKGDFNQTPKLGEFGRAVANDLIEYIVSKEEDGIEWAAFMIVAMSRELCKESTDA